ncbi:MAG TPA: hypothetical protein VLW52_01250 [Opitutaceae bacterium]|nr:hypothetical protein [Opitutaceae bacterium]
MRIEKWYLDSVAPEGSGMIGYAARLAWGPCSIRCAETLRWRADGQPAETRFTLGGSQPRETADGVTWRCRALEAEGQWRREGAPLATVTLVEEPRGRIDWTCLCPAAQVAVRVGGESQDGFGYVERLAMTLPPARLPIRQLRWGRFLADSQNLLWIEWRGAADRRWCFHNGRPVHVSMSDPRALAWEGHRLRLEAGFTLRSGRVLNTALQAAGGLRWLLPRAIRNLEETKWCCAGVLTDRDGREHSGWAIHEIVHFR